MTDRPPKKKKQDFCDMWLNFFDKYKAQRIKEKLFWQQEERR